MNERKKFALGILLGLVVLTLVAFVPSLTDFNSGQFNTDNRTVTIGAAVPLTNASLRSPSVYQKDINSLAFSVSVYNTSTITNVEEWRSVPYPFGSPNMLGNVDMNGNLFMSGNGNFGSGAAAGTPSAIRLIDSTTGKYWQWSELGAQSNIIERLPTNGNNGLSWGIKMWTNAAIATDGTPTNQAMNFQLGTGLSVDWANRQITSSGLTPSGDFARLISYWGTNTWVPSGDELVYDSYGGRFSTTVPISGGVALANGSATYVTYAADAPIAGAGVPDTGFAHYSLVPSNTSGYFADTRWYSAGTTPTHIWQSNFTMKVSFVLEGDYWTNSMVYFGLQGNPATGAIQASAVRWIGRLDWSSNFIADVSNNNVHAYRTSSVPCDYQITNALRSLEIRAMTTNQIDFLTNGVLFTSFTTNSPGGQAIVPHEGIATTLVSPGVTGTNHLYVDQHIHDYR